ncbi:hypothetical protein [Nakamurella endophytica]|uniref:hypothetical protein n=1 Tax=Nakamurella endophytica TaxID=1748367 RepID=UPI00166EB69A|nr:hypothetical protein [Nakamurella endophytica]
MTTLRHRIRLTQVVGRRVPLSSALISELTRPSVVGEDALARVRVAHTFGLDIHVEPQPVGLRGRRSPAGAWAVRTVCNVLAAAGPQPLDVLVEAVARSRTLIRPAPSPAELYELLAGSGTVRLGRGRLWTLVVLRPPIPPHARLLAAMGDRVYSWSAMVRVLTELGYASVSARGRILDRHPLIRRLERNRYQLILPVAQDRASAHHR